MQANYTKNFQGIKRDLNIFREYQIKMIDKKTLKQTIGKLFIESGFKKFGQSWQLDGQDAMIEFSFQKSNWVEEYYIDISIRIKDLYDNDESSGKQNHFSHRLERLFPEKLDLIRKSTSLEKSDLQTLNEFSEFIKQKVIPFINDCTRINNLKEYLLAGRFASGLVSIDAVNFLS